MIGYKKFKEYLEQTFREKVSSKFKHIRVNFKVEFSQDYHNDFELQMGFGELLTCEFKRISTWNYYIRENLGNFSWIKKVMSYRPVKDALVEDTLIDKIDEIIKELEWNDIELNDDKIKIVDELSYEKYQLAVNFIMEKYFPKWVKRDEDEDEYEDY